MRTVAVLGLLLTVALAGCLGGSGDTPTNQGPPRPAAATLDCAVACNIEATVSPEARQANELTIAVNPTDPLNILASGKDYTPGQAGDCVWDGLYATFDGGRTWTNSNLPGSNWARLADPTAPVHPQFSKFWCATDPVLAFGPDGTAYWSVMPYQCDAVSGSKTGDGVAPDGGFNDWLWTCSSMYVLVSDDGGRTWPVVNEVAFGPRLEHDKQWMSVAPDGRVLLCWDRDPSYQLSPPGDNPAAQLQRPGYMQCAVSSDKGRSWTEPTDVNPPADPATGSGGSWDGYLPWVDWDGDGTAWMTALDSAGNVIVSSSPDGLAWTKAVVVGNYTNPPPNGAFGWPALQGSTFRSFALPSLAVDRSGGPFDGSLYVAWMDHSGDDAEVLLTRSRDGTTWSEPRRIHDDAPDSGFDQFMPALSVGPDGTVDAVWYDRRDDPENHLFDLYHAYSLDGGATWSQNLRVSEVSSDEQYSHHQNGMVFLGDYIDLDSGPGRAYPVWVDTRAGQADAYIAVIERPGANP